LLSELIQSLRDAQRELVCAPITRALQPASE
jgi:hypothetical protein